MLFGGVKSIMEKVKFNNGKLTVLQISDAQDMHWVRKAMLIMIENACERVKPDLIVFTGDNVLGNHLCDYRFTDRKKNLTENEEYEILKKALKHIIDIPERKNIPFAAIFGNHDDWNSVTKEKHADIFRQSSMNRGLENRNGLCGTYCLPIYSSDGENRVMNFWMLDTAGYDKKRDACYEKITEEQVDWFKKESDKLKSENGGKPYPSLVFMHIPFKQITELYEECDKNNSQLEAEGRYYRLKPCSSGKLGELSSVLTDDSGMYNAIIEDSGVKGIVSGHDHRNCFTGEYDGMKFIATPCASFRCYGNETRGVRVFEIDEKSPEKFKTYTLSYTDLCGNGVISKLRYLRDADEMEKVKHTVIAFSAAIAAGVSIISAATVLRRHHTISR